jgi:hypothetical protein
LDLAAKGYAWVIFFGFSIVPLAVLAQKFELISFFEPTLFSAALALHQ